MRTKPTIATIPPFCVFNAHRSSNIKTIKFSIWIDRVRFLTPNTPCVSVCVQKPYTTAREITITLRVFWCDTMPVYPQNRIDKAEWKILQAWLIAKSIAIKTIFVCAVYVIGEIPTIANKCMKKFIESGRQPIFISLNEHSVLEQFKRNRFVLLSAGHLSRAHKRIDNVHTHTQTSARLHTKCI